MRADDGLAFMLQYENVAWYEQGCVRILDRRCYPAEISFVNCYSCDDIAQAIRNMVTQSGGPWIAAKMGIVLQVELSKNKPFEIAVQELEKAAYVVTHARPTTSLGMVHEVNLVKNVAVEALHKGEDALKLTHEYVLKTMELRYKRSREMADFFVDTLSQEPTIMTQCFAETLIGNILLSAKEKGKYISLYCPETRPYLQGARLTASVAADMNIPVTVITDNMPAYVLSQGNVEACIAAADVITMDGYVVNKIGTFQIALAAKHFAIPFYIIGNPNQTNPTIDTVHIEERNPEDVLHAMGIKTTMPGVKGYYPAFDITPPEFITGIVTSRGILSPYSLK